MLMVAAFIYLLGRHLRERKRTEAVIHEQRELFRTTISSIGDAVLTTDTDGRVKSLNRIAQSLTGWTEEAALGQDLKTVFPIVNEQTNIPAENPAARVLRGGTIVGLANHTILVARDGSRRPIDDSAAPIRDANGNVLGAVMVFRDVSERRKTEAAVQAEAYTLATLNRVGRTVAATFAETLMVFLATTAPAHFSALMRCSDPQDYNLRYRNLRSRIQSSEQLEQKREFLRRVPGQVVVLGVADDEFGVLVTQVGGVDGLDRGHDGGLRIGVVHVCRDHIIERDRPGQPHHRVVEVGPQGEIFDMGRLAFAVERDDERETDRDLGRGNGDNEKDHDLAVQVV